MVWYLDITLGAVVAFAFILAGILYSWSKEEVDNLFSSLRLNKVFLWIAAVFSGVILAIALRTSWREIFSLILFSLILVLGSISFAGTGKKMAMKYSAISATLFFIFFMLAHSLGS